MRVQINYKFNRGFELAEEGAVKIVDIIKNRLPNLATNSIKFEVGRADHALVTYDTVSEVMAEQNGKFDRIESVKIFSSLGDDHISLTFEKAEKTQLSITSSDRDSALLAFAELRDYIRSEVIRQRMAKFVSLLMHRQAVPIILLVSTIIFFVATMSTLVGAGRTKPPLNPNDAQKLDFLYRNALEGREILLSSNIPVVIFLGYFVLVVGGSAFVYLLKYGYQTDIFYWGKEIQRVNGVRSAFGKIFWTIFIGFVVSVLAGVFLGLFN